jgi:hypothetical protein
MTFTLGSWRTHVFKKAELREAIGQLGKVVRGAQLEMKAYAFGDGEIRASSASMIGGVPLEYDGEFAVNSDAFDKAVAALNGDITVEAGMRTLQLIAGKTRVSLPKLDPEMVRKRRNIEGVTVDVDDDFAGIAKLLTSVVSEQRVLDWQSSLIVKGKDLVAMDRGNLMVAATYEPFAHVEHALIPLDIVDIITSKRTPPREVVISPQNIMVDFRDDSWVIGQMITGSVPNKVFDLLNQPAPGEMSEITAEQRAAIQQIDKIGATTIDIEPKRMIATHEHGEMTIEVDSPVTKTTRWGVSHISRAVALATQWHLDAYPVRAWMASDKLRILVAAQQL